MHYYIDGYNLLFRFLHAGDDLKTQREQLVKELQLKINALKLDATLVFDSHYQPDDGSRVQVDQLTLIFTRLGETADEYILNELKEAAKPSQHTVITSDKKLAWYCRRRLALTESVEDFMAMLNRRYRNFLRQKKERVNPLSELPLPQVPTPSRVLTPLIPLPTPPSLPQKEIPKKPRSVEECFDYYLDIFEKEVEKVVEKPLSKQRQLKLKRKKPVPKEKDSQEVYKSELERWESLFEKQIEEDQ